MNVIGNMLYLKTSSREEQVESASTKACIIWLPIASDLGNQRIKIKNTHFKKLRRQDIYIRTKFGILWLVGRLSTETRYIREWYVNIKQFRQLHVKIWTVQLFFQTWDKKDHQGLRGRCFPVAVGCILHWEQKKLSTRPNAVLKTLLVSSDDHSKMPWNGWLPHRNFFFPYNSGG